MSDKEYEEYEKACAKIKVQNAQLLADFKEWLTTKGLAEKTIQQHVQNADFYVNTFLLYRDAVPASEGVTRIATFLGDWFIRKALWASPSSIRSSAASLKKFYTFLHQRGAIDADDLQELKETIKEERPDWLAALGEYDDPDNDDPRSRWGL